MPKSIEHQAKSHKKPKQKDLVREWLLAGEKLDVISVRQRTGNHAFHLFGRINELKKDGFRFDERFVPVAEGSPYKIVWLHADFVADIQNLGVVGACQKELARKRLEKEMGEVA